MSSNMQAFYLARAEDSSRLAEDATLANARDRFLVAETTWRNLAMRAQRLETLQAKMMAEKTAERAAATLAVMAAHGGST